MVPPVILFKEKRGPTDDPYEKALRVAGYPSIFLQVLDHQLVNEDALRTIVTRGPADRYSGLIFTSQRAVQAWEAAASSQARPWSDIPFFAVGPSTALALGKIGGPAGPTQDQIFGADESGSGDRLADLIISHLDRQGRPERPLLYLVGDKRRDAVSRKLGHAGIGLEEIMVYETSASATAEARLGSVLDELRRDHREPEPPDETRSPLVSWVVFFSPSGCGLVPALRREGVLPTTPTGHEGPFARIAAIGPTTRDHLSQKLDITVDATASHPDPDHLLEAMRSADPGR